jgi:hypothetical protein
LSSGFFECHAILFFDDGANLKDLVQIKKFPRGFLSDNIVVDAVPVPTDDAVIEMHDEVSIGPDGSLDRGSNVDRHVVVLVFVDSNRGSVCADDSVILVDWVPMHGLIF